MALKLFVRFSRSTNVYSKIVKSCRSKYHPSTPLKFIMSKRLKEIILRNHYKPTEYINMNKPLALRDRVSLKKTKPEAATCITEMAVLMSCWKQHDFTDADCSDEINLFNKCLADSELVKREASQAGKTGTAQKLTSKQINELLWKYPLPKQK